MVVQVTTTFVTFAPAMLPLLFAITQDCDAGRLATVTLYTELSASAVAKVKLPLAATARSSAPLLRNTSEPVIPLTVPPTV